MPQIEQLSATYASQIFWLVLVFGLIFFVVGRGMVPKIQGTIDSRDKTVADDLAAAEAARAAADQVEEEWRVRENQNRAAAQALHAEARGDAARAAAARLAEAGAGIDARIADAEARIAASSRAAMGEVETVAAEAARDIVVRLSGDEVSEDEARARVKAVMHG